MGRPATKTPAALMATTRPSPFIHIACQENACGSAEDVEGDNFCGSVFKVSDRIMNQPKIVKEQEITDQDLQAMKQMIREIRNKPELLYEYSSIFFHLKQSRKGRLPTML